MNFIVFIHFAFYASDRCSRWNGRRGRGRRDVPEACVSWVGLKVLQDVLSLPILGIYRCFLLFYVAVSSWSFAPRLASTDLPLQGAKCTTCVVPYIIACFVLSALKSFTINMKEEQSNFVAKKKRHETRQAPERKEKLRKSVGKAEPT